MEKKLAVTSKTVWFGVALVALGALEAAQQLPFSMPEWTLSVIGIAVVALRTVTKNPVAFFGKKKAEEE